MLELKSNTMKKSNFNPLIHNRKSIRIKNHDYASKGLYFLTIMTRNRMSFFGEIQFLENKSAEMILSEAGQVVNRCWLDIPNHYPKVILHEFIIMPNHIHGIIEITEVISNPEYDKDIASISGIRKNEFQQIIPKSIGSIVRGFKIGVTKWFRENTTYSDIWQSNYHERIIRDYDGYLKAIQYTKDNPKNWQEDVFYVK